MQALAFGRALSLNKRLREAYSYLLSYKQEREKMSRSTLTVFYGPKQVTDGAVLDHIAQAIDGHKDYVVSNQSMGGDTQPGTYKYATVYYSLNPAQGPIRSRVAGEGKPLTFGTDIASIIYGPKIITDPAVYIAAYNAFVGNNPYPVSNQSMGGDPQYGTVKYGQALYYRNGQTVVQESAKEGTKFEWKGQN
ncbi:hypothetical protein GP486_000599 [Trichoglossum hirsutum]|uniref:Uncharacterized protein n=1 Tax=Trichoglossum hirsutum TaxID=265104 RepID=A0A9P8RTE8_9PEZI|nr:hypothetical protein GP486_000599 [Trichoglossum hirsutum]